MVNRQWDPDLNLELSNTKAMCSFNTTREVGSLQYDQQGRFREFGESPDIVVKSPVNGHCFSQREASYTASSDS